MEKEEKARIENFNEMIDSINEDVKSEIEKEERVANELFNEKAKKQNGIMQRIWQTVLFKLLGKFKVKITLYYDEKVVFEYVIPKD